MSRRKKIASEEKEKILEKTITNEFLGNDEGFDYSELSEDVKLRSYERKARIKANEQVATKAFYDVAQDVKAQHDDLNNYQQWLEWCEKELGYKSTMSEQLLKIGKELPHYSGVDFLPSSKNSLFALAQALGNAKSKEEKQKIIETVKAKTEEKGKPLTEKEIKEIFEQEQEKKIEQIKKMLQSNPSFTVDYLVQDSGLSLKIVQEVVFSFRRQKELNELSETVKIQKDANANLLESYQKLKGISAEQLEEIENLNSIIAKLNVERKDLALKQAELDQQIKSEVNVKVEDLLQQERKELEAKIKQLEAKEQELNSQSKQLQSSLQDVEKVKSNLNNLNDWIATLNQFNHSLNEQTQYLIATWSKIQDLPDLDSLEESEREIANKKLSNVIGEFHAHSDKYARALGNFHGALDKIEHTVLKTIDVAQEVV